MTRHTPDQFDAIVGDRLRNARLDAGQTQANVATAVGIPQSHVSDLERGHSAPSLRMVVRLALALGRDPGDLLPTLAQIRAAIGADVASKITATK